MAETSIAARVPRLGPPSSGVEKAAILLLTLGSETAAAVLGYLSEAEVRHLSTAMAHLRSIPRTQLAAVNEEAWRWLTSREGFLVDGEQFMRQLISARAAAGGNEKEAMRELSRTMESGAGDLASYLEPVSAPVIAQVLAGEHPQVIALVLAHLQPKQAAEVLAALPEDTTPDIVHRISDLKSVPPELLAEVSAVLQREVQGLGTPQGASQGPASAKLAADIMNLVDKSVETRVFSYLDETAPQVAENIRNLMLTFEDLLRLENRDMQTLLKELPREDLMLALKTASPAMKSKIFGNVSKRAAEIMQDDMSQMGPVKLKDVEKAQSNIVAVARRLTEEQKITMGGGSGGDALV
jgi:flagellar motor switch protein FliG